MKNTNAFYKADTVEELCDLINEYTEFTANIGDNYITLSCDTPFNRDFSFDIEICNDLQKIIADIQFYCFNYDIDEDVAMYLEAKRDGLNGVPSAVDLVTDCESVASSLDVLDEWLNKVNNENYTFESETSDVINAYRQGLSKQERKEEHNHSCLEKAYQVLINLLYNENKLDHDAADAIETAIDYLDEILRN